MNKGRLKIFFGYSAGVGKTYAMLQAAHMMKKKNIDIVIGYVEPHQRPDTQKLTEQLESLPLRMIEYRGIHLNEFDIDAALRRRPQILLADELAHTNAAGSKHTKRYMDIQEALNAGIDVYTTVNVQHIESLNDIISSITGIRVNETIPDAVFDEADEVELIDIEPKALEERLRSGKIYRPGQAAAALENFFTQEKLNSLRETAMRRMADRIEHKTQAAGIKPRILALVSPSPSSAQNIRTASRMAENAHTRFYALYVERGGSLSEHSSETLKAHLRLIQSLGGELTVRYGDDIIDIITGFVKQNGITTIILGKTWQSAGKKPGFEDRIVAALPGTEILIIPDNRSSSAAGSAPARSRKTAVIGKRRRMLLAAASLWCAAGFAVQTASPFAAVCMQTAAAVLCCIGIIRNTVKTAKLRLQYAETNRTLDALQTLDRTVLASEQQTAQSPLPEICEALAGIFGTSVQIAVFVSEPAHTAALIRQSAEQEDISFFDLPEEQAVCSWCRANKKPAGCGTDTLRHAHAAYYPLIYKDRCAAVLSFSCRRGALSLADRLLLTQLETRLALYTARFL